MQSGMQPALESIAVWILLQIGEVLCRYEVEKKLAVEREDYDTAKERKVREGYVVRGNLVSIFLIMKAKHWLLPKKERKDIPSRSHTHTLSVAIR